ncbi:FtsX-like permease family protein [Nannocystaceae bacterium ST9]
MNRPRDPQGWTGSSSLEWRIAWRHLRVGERHPRWVDLLMLVSAFLMLVGMGFVLWAGTLGPEPLPGEQLFSAAGSSALQRQFGVFGGLSIGMGVMALVLALLARFFNLLATIITMSVLLGCMALVVVLSLMSGLEADLRDKILAQKAHLRISSAEGHRFTDYEALTEAIAALPEVSGASPYLEAEIMVRSGINRQGAVLVGVQPDRLAGHRFGPVRLREVSNIADIVKEGSFTTLIDPASIPDPDPFALSDPETPWRLRHLDEDDDELSIRRQPAPFQPKLEDKLENKRAPIELPNLDDPEPGSRKLPGPPVELFGPPGGPFGAEGLPGEGGDDWEDPVEVLGLDGDEGRESETGEPAEPREDPPREDPPREDPPRPADADEGGDDWEDPVEVLDLPDQPEPDPAGDETGEPEPDPETEPDAPRREGVVDPILIGRELANELAVGVGARVQLITPVGRLTPAGRVPGILAAKVGGVFLSGMYEYDRKNVYTPLPVAQAFLRTGDRVTGIEVKLLDIDALEAGQAAVAAELARQGRGDELIVESWKQLNRNLFSAMFLEKIAMFVALLFVVLVASFGILASNLMSVLEKSKEIAILKAMGSPDTLIQRVFVAEGLVLGLLGAIGGIAVGLSLCFALDRFGFPFNENVYYIERLPVVVDPVEVAVVGVAALFIVWLSSLYPARIASRMRPVDGLRQQDK